MSTTNEGRDMKRSSNIRSRLVHRISVGTSGKGALKGELLASSSNLWFLLFLALPTVIVVIFGFASVNYDLTITYRQMTTDNYLSALNPSGRVIGLTVRTIFISIITALGSLAVGFPIAYYLARIASEKRRGVLVSLIIIPFWISFVVQLYALLPWVRREGYIGQALDFLQGLGAHYLGVDLHLKAFADWAFENLGYGSANIVAPALIYIWLPFMTLPLFTALLRIDPVLLEAAQDLGAGKWKTFWNVTVPLSYNGIVTGTVLIFITAFGSFVEPKLLGGKDGNLVGNFIDDAFHKFGNLPSGAAASVIVLIPTILLLYVYMAYAGEYNEETLRNNILFRGLRWIRGRIPRPPIRQPTAADGGPVVDVPMSLVPRGFFERGFDRIASGHGATVLRIFCLLVLASFYIPLAQVVVFSFNHDTNIINWSSPSLRWYFPEATKGAGEIRSLFDDPAMISLGWPLGPSWGALWNSLWIGLAVTAISLAVGIPAALAVVRYRFSSKPFLDVMLYTGLVMPSIIMGVSILVFINVMNDLYLWPYLRATWELGYWSIIVGHVTFSIPIVIVVLIVSLREFDRSLEEAAMDLGANEIVTFVKVTLPIIMPGMVAAALLAFTFSFSEVVVTLFLKGQGIETLPVVFWATLFRKTPTPELNAASTLILGLSIVFVLIANRVQRGGTMFRF